MSGDSHMEGHDYRTCKVEDCPECQSLVDNGLVMACDGCGTPGSTESDGWTLMPDGRTLCDLCYSREPKENPNRKVVLEILKRNALIFVDAGNPYAGCVVDGQRRSREATLFALLDLGFVEASPWRITVKGKEYLDSIPVVTKPWRDIPRKGKKGGGL